MSNRPYPLFGLYFVILFHSRKWHSIIYICTNIKVPETVSSLVLLDVRIFCSSFRRRSARECRLPTPPARFLPRLWIFSALAKYTWQFYHRQFFFGGAARISMWIQLMQTPRSHFGKITQERGNLYNRDYSGAIITSTFSILNRVPRNLKLQKYPRRKQCVDKTKSRTLAKYLSTGNDLREILKRSSSNFRGNPIMI